MNAGSLEQQLERARQRLESLAGLKGIRTEKRVLMAEILEEVSTTMEEMETTSEELRLQNEELKMTRQSVEEESQRYQDLFEFAPDVYLVTDPEGIITEANSAATTLLGVRPDFLLGKPLATFVSNGERKAFREAVARANRTKQKVEDWQLNLQPRERLAFPASVTVGVVRDGAGRSTGLRWLIRDITARRQAEEQLRVSREQLRALTAHLESVRERERAAASKEVHDELGQGMAGVKLKLASLATQLPKDQPALQTDIREILMLLDALLKVSVRISEGLHSSPLEVLGLVPALQAEARAFQARTGISCQIVDDSGKLQLGRTQATALFHVCQEVLTNVADHAQATRASIGLQREVDHLVLAIADNGKGIPEEEIASPNSLGLLRMREQALSLGGELHIAGQSGEGTTVTVRMRL